MAYTTINDPSQHFQTTLYTGNGNSSSRAITNSGNSNLQPDWLWIKVRSTTDNNFVLDSSRGPTKQLKTNGTDAEDTVSHIASFNTDGFNITSTDQGYNANSQTYVAWQWKCNGGTTSSNSSGSITSTVQANTTAGFSIVTYTGNAVSGATVGHGLGSTPKMIIIKNRDSVKHWLVYHQATSVSATRGSFLDLTDPSDGDNGYFNNTEPTSSVFSIGNDTKCNASGDDHIAYCFAEKKGYSKIGTYTGNGQNGGSFIYTGFKPAWVLGKRVDTAKSWYMFDNKRDTENVMDGYLYANENSAESTGTGRIDFLSNGFKWRNSAQVWNADGGDYLYMAFAENPFVSSAGVPTTAR